MLYFEGHKFHGMGLSQNLFYRKLMETPSRVSSHVCKEFCQCCLVKIISVNSLVYFIHKILALKKGALRYERSAVLNITL